MKELCFDEAARLARALQHDALWNGQHCTWLVNQPMRGDAEVGKRELVTAGANVYQGSAGIALFLAEWAAVSGDATCRRTAEGALRHAIAGGALLPNHAFGLYAGRVGIALVADRVSRLFGSDEWAHAARGMIAPLIGHETGDVGLDVIGGAAGAIPPLIRLSRSWSDARLLESAIVLGNTLVRQARWSSSGCSWRPQMAGVARDLTGYAHGTAGFAHALFELFAATEQETFYYAARQAHGFENANYSETLRNWTDHRHLKLCELLVRDPTQLGVRDAVLRGDVGPYQAHGMLAWCHGAPGIGMERLRAWELFRQPDDLRDARRAIEATRDALKEHSPSYTLCHGAFGNAMLLVCAAGVDSESPTADPLLEETVRRGMEVARRDGRWRTALADAGPEPSLMLGSAGIGLFLLRMAAVDVPNPLFYAGVDAVIPRTPRCFGQQQVHLGTILPVSMEYFRETSPEVIARVEATATPDRAPREVARDLLSDLMHRPSSAEVSADPRVRRCVAELSCAILGPDLEDRSWGDLVRAARAKWDSLDVGECEFVIAPQVWLLDPVAILANAGGSGGAGHEEDDDAGETWIVRDGASGLSAVPVGALVAAILRVSLSAVDLDRLSEVLELDHPKGRAAILDQVMQLFRAGILIDAQTARLLRAPVGPRWLDASTSGLPAGA